MEENYEIGASFKSELNSCLEDGEDLLIQVPKEEETSAERDLASCKKEGESLFIQVPKEVEETSAELGLISCWERGEEEDPLIQGLKEEEAETSAEPDLISCWEGGEDPVMQEPKEEEETSAAAAPGIPNPPPHSLQHRLQDPDPKSRQTEWFPGDRDGSSGDHRNSSPLSL
ncbi:uncharacterized protein LOC133381916 [Rhineura floridana]|uniref:uncharacterized protein LOC133381916 n=1 Tax=Rhineura floridana TaxID=261503 RepID=UPI002AC8532C|nr:uncharacterized protein LOC133381916 [Rhineura floridana]